MTEAEFITKYHEYSTTDPWAAVAEAIVCRTMLGLPAVAVDFGELGYGLMLRPAADALKLKIVRPQDVIHPDETDRCLTCGYLFAIGEPAYACDKTMGIFCAADFEELRCEELHGEGCMTQIYQA